MLSNRGELQPQNGKKLRILRIHVVLSENISECCKWSKYYANKITTKTYLHWATSKSPTCKTMYTQNDINNNRKRCKVKRFTTCKATYAQNDVNNNKPFDGRCELWGRGWMFLRMYVMTRNEMCGIRGMFTDSRTRPQRVHDALSTVDSKILSWPLETHDKVTADGNFLKRILGGEITFPYALYLVLLLFKSISIKD